MAQDNRALSVNEHDLRARLKRKVIALAVIEHARKKQSARIANMKEGDANSKFFHLRVNARRRKNHIHRLKHNNGWVTDHGAKEQIVHSHFDSTLKKGNARTLDFNWDALHFSDPNLNSLGEPFSEEEVEKALNLMPSDKGPGPDGFTGAFFKKCWEHIKVDVMNAIGGFGALHGHNFLWLNSANIVIIPKKEGAKDISDFRPISLIHANAKIIAKLLALFLAPFMNELVSNAQLLTTIFGLQRRYLKMASNEKVVNTKVVRLVETNNFAFWIIAIRSNMQPPGRTHSIRHIY
jgi:hypothetical protein